jgi:hypothetical protein
MLGAAAVPEAKTPEVKRNSATSDGGKAAYVTGDCCTRNLCGEYTGHKVGRCASDSCT